MQTRHVPPIAPRYWCAIILASIFGTNLGDFYAHESGLGLLPGVAVLVALFVIAYRAESRDRRTHEFYYWLAIIIIRTGATNIADYLAFRVRIPALLLSSGLAATLAILAWRNAAARRVAANDAAAPPLAATNLLYWAAMLAAGVFGTVVGDISSHNFSQGPSAIVLTALFAGVLAAAGSRAATRPAIYWLAIALARIAGTCIGDWLAENKTLHIGLPFSTLLTGTAFIATLLLWRNAQQASRTAA